MGSRALVLGGGGITGIAWELGVLQALGSAGVDLAAADLVVGTSAGSVVGAQLTGGFDLGAIFAAELRPQDGSSQRGAELDAVLRLRAELAAILKDTRDLREARVRIGAAALAASTVPEAEWIDAFAARLRVREWPRQRLLITAVDAGSGEPVVWDRASGVPLVLAAAASCAVPTVWPPVTIGDRRHVDGGMRTPTNVDLAAGHDVVVVLAPVSGPTIGSSGIEDEVAPLRRAGSRVVIVAPDEAAVRAFGPNPLDPAGRAAAARAGQAQGEAAAEAVREAWTVRAASGTRSATEPGRQTRT